MATTPLILVVADRPAEHDALHRAIAAEHCRAVFANDFEAASAHANEHFALVVLNYRISRSTAIPFMSEWRIVQSATPFLLLIDSDDAEATQAALEAHADGILRKPANTDELRFWIRKFLQQSHTDTELRSLRVRLDQRLGFEAFIGQSKPIGLLLDQARAAAESDVPVLISGEPGTGKRMLAEIVHQNSRRSAGRFVVFAVPTLPVRLVERELFGVAHGGLAESETRQGSFQAAAGGTLLIDDIAELAAVTQARLLRVLDRPLLEKSVGMTHGAVPVRIIAATVRKLEALAAEGRFSSNLLRRIGGIRLRLPPLRERREDIPLLIDHFLRAACEEHEKPLLRMEPELLRFLERYEWPANVRQLQNCLASMVALTRTDVLALDDLPAQLDDPSDSATGVYVPAGMSLAELERTAVEQALSYCEGNRTRAADRLGISVRTLQRKLKAWGREAGAASEGELASNRIFS